MRRFVDPLTGVISLILLLNLVACNAPAKSSSTQEAQQPAIEGTASPTPHFATVVSDPSRDIPGSGACPIPAATAQPPDLGSLQDPGPELLTFLNQGGALDRLRTALGQAGLLPEDGHGIIQADFTGDGLLDVALGLSGAHPSDDRAGPLLTFPCQGDHYNLEVIPSPASAGIPAVIQSTMDLNGDDVSDLLVTRRRCGAHTCSIQTSALIWQTDHLEDRLEGTSEDLPSPTLQILDAGPSGAASIQITSHGVASVGAGPPRRITRTWVWDPADESFKPEPDVLGASSFRVHVLHDAEAAARAGDYAAALSGYQRAIEQDELQDWGDEAQARGTLSAFAAFRRVHTLLLLDEREQAVQEMEALRNEHPQGAAGAVYADLAERFWDAYQASGDVDQACRQVYAYASSAPSRYLEPLYYGYANPSYEIEQLCPLSDGRGSKASFPRSALERSGTPFDRQPLPRLLRRASLSQDPFEVVKIVHPGHRA